MTVGTANPVSPTSTTRLMDYDRCPELPAFGVSGTLGEANGFFRFGPDVICYGQTVGQTNPKADGLLEDVAGETKISDEHVFVPFDITRLVDNLRYEAYVQSRQRWVEKSWVRDLYY